MSPIKNFDANLPLTSTTVGEASVPQLLERLRVLNGGLDNTLVASRSAQRLPSPRAVQEIDVNQGKQLGNLGL